MVISDPAVKDEKEKSASQEEQDDDDEARSEATFRWGV